MTTHTITELLTQLTTKLEDINTKIVEVSKEVKRQTALIEELLLEFQEV